MNQWIREAMRLCFTPFVQALSFLSRNHLPQHQLVVRLYFPYLILKDFFLKINQYVDHYQNLEVEYDKLTEVLNKDFGNQKVITAMIENYQLRLKVLESIRLHIELQNKLKNQSHEDVFNNA